MLKKIASLLLSLLLCLSALSGPARAAGVPPEDDPPVMIEPLDPETPEDPESPVEPVLPACAEELPTEKSDHQT